MKRVSELRQAMTAAVLWLVLAAILLLPGVELPLRRIWLLLLLAALVRTVHLAVSRRWPQAERQLAGATIAADTLLLT